MFEKLEAVESKFVQLENDLGTPLSSDDFRNKSKERANLEELVHTYREYKVVKKEFGDAKEIIEAETDEELRSLAKEEIQQLEKKIADLEKHLIVLSLPSDPNDNKNVILEIRAGTGGEEASLFVADLLRMYLRYADNRHWKHELLSSTQSEKGGFKEVIVMIEGQKVYSRMKFESGVHRVQRVPETEAQGRIHTSAVTVAILPEADEVDVKIDPTDLEISVCRSSGAGGQSVNTADSAVRMVHIPSGLVVECQDERSQLKNKDKALKILKARLKEKLEREQQQKISASRKSQVGSGDRSERIRTYNFPQGRMTDHRINLTLYSLSEIMDGKIDNVLDALGTHHQTELLKQSFES